VVGESLFLVTVKYSDVIYYRPLPHGKHSDTFSQLASSALFTAN